MPKGRYFVFEPFRLDVLDERLWECDRSVRLGHKALAVLQRLVSQPGQLVTKDDLLATAWPDTAVTDEVLTTAMRELRRALGDPARTPRFVETVHGRGYRFIAPVAETDIPVLKAKSTTAQSNEADALVPCSFPRVVSSGRLVGREAEWVRLEEWYATVQQGRRQIGFVAGEAGIGKTALVEVFVSELAARRKARVGRGQCVEHYGAGEAYLPILEALGRLGRDPAMPVADLLRDHAPSWLVHLPSLASGKEFEGSVPATPEKMLRELADALEVFTARDPLILVLEDLHWSDTATLAVLAYVARRPDPARLLILGTYRPIEALLHRHPLRDVIAELRPHPQCAELVLDYLSGEAVGAYLLQRCGPVPRLKELAEVLGRRTGGLPLFVTTVVDELMRRRVLDGTDAAGFAPTDLQAIENVIPTGVCQFIEHRFEQLAGEDQAILEAAGVAGDPFSVAAVAAATWLPEERVEARCVAWARQGQFVSADGTVAWPDGKLAARYRFRHALFQEVVYAHTSPERRARLHQRIGRRLERAYGKGAAAIAAELAMHFEQGRDSRRAASYLGQAARNALQRSAYSEARGHLTRGLGLLESLREGRERLRQELELSLLLGQVLMTTKGWGDEEVGRVYARSRELCEQLGDAPRLLQATYGLIVVSMVRAELRKAQALSWDLLALAKKRRDPVYEVLAHTELGGTGFALGEPASVGRHFTQAGRLYHPRQHRSHVAAFGMDMGLFSRMWETHFLWHQGYPDRARARAQKTLGLARKLSHPFALAITLAYAAMLSQFHRDVDQVERLAEATIAQCAEHGFPYYRAWAEVLQGWSRSARGAGVEGVATIRPAIEVLQPMAGLRLPYYLALLAEACGWTARADEAHQALADAFADVQKTEQRWWEAELHRLRGELLRSEGMNQGAEAQACFLTAIEIAHGQQAKSLELRAAVSLGRLWRDEGKGSQARRVVGEVYDWFTEGFDTPDLRDATSLLEELTR